jgi:hypothetical protein
MRREQLKDRNLWENNITTNLKERVSGYGLVVTGSGHDPVVGCYEYSNKCSGSIKCK